MAQHHCVHGMRVWDDEGIVYSRCGFGCGETDDGLFYRIAAAAARPEVVEEPKAPSTQVATIVPVPTTTTVVLRPSFDARVNQVARNEHPSFTVLATPPPKAPPTMAERLAALRPDWVASH